MGHLDDLRRARASLAWLFEPSEPQLRDFVATHGPVEAFDRLRDGRLPATGLREEVRRVRAEQLWQEAASAVNDAQGDGVRILIPEDPDWPAGLADLATPPGGDAEAALCLWVRDSLPAAVTLHRSVTVTGSRAATAYGTHVATDLGYDLASHGWAVLAAGAYGVDAAAHRGALTGEGATVAALPGGLDRPFPTGNAALFDRIASQGLLLSAWPPGATPSRARLVANQRLLAALSRGVVVVEAALRSGALNTLRQAITLGRPAMVVPGPITSTTSAGCHQALRQHPQVRLVTGIADVLDELER